MGILTQEGWLETVILSQRSTKWHKRRSQAAMARWTKVTMLLRKMLQSQHPRHADSQSQVLQAACPAFPDKVPAVLLEEDLSWPALHLQTSFWTTLLLVPESVVSWPQLRFPSRE